MAELFYDKVWVREPRLMVPRQAPLGKVRLDTSHWLAKRAAAIVVGNTELIANRKVTFVGAKYEMRYSAMCIRTTNSANTYAKVQIPFPISGDMTFLYHGAREATLEQTRNFLVAKNTETSGNYVSAASYYDYISFHHWREGGGAGGALVWGQTDASYFLINKMSFYSAQIGADNTTSRAYSNGSLIPGNSGLTSSGSSPQLVNELVFGADQNYSYPGAFSCASCIIVPGLLTSEEYMRWYTNPYEFCIPA